MDFLVKAYIWGCYNHRLPRRAKSWMHRPEEVRGQQAISRHGQHDARLAEHRQHQNRARLVTESVSVPSEITPCPQAGRPRLKALAMGASISISTSLSTAATVPEEADPRESTGCVRLARGVSWNANNKSGLKSVALSSFVINPQRFRLTSEPPFVAFLRAPRRVSSIGPPFSL
jgi:hypothetical protein